MKKMIIPAVMVFALLAGVTSVRAMHGSEQPKEQNLMKSVQMKLQHMNELLGILSDRMKETIPEEQRKEMGEIMKELSRGMGELADIIQSGKVTEEQLERLNKRLLELRMRINKLFEHAADV